MTSIAKVFVRILPLTPCTLHAQCEPTLVNNGLCHIEGNDEHTCSICVTTHSCAAGQALQGAVVLSSAACKVVGTRANQQVWFTPIMVNNVILSFDSRLPNSLPLQVTVSQSLRSTLETDGSECILIPSRYSVGYQNITGRILGVHGDRSLLDLSVCVHPDALGMLGISNGTNVQIYTVDRSRSIKLRVLEHPGWCFLDNARTTISAHAGDSVILEHGTRKAVVQVHNLTPDLNLESGSYVDPHIADILGIQNSATVRCENVEAELFWARKHPVDDIRSKARSIIGMPPETFVHRKYIVSETVHALYEGKSCSALLEVSDSTVSQSEVALTPLVMRSTVGYSGRGLFVRRSKRKCVTARVGIFNVDEVGSAVVIGSDHLMSECQMPCLVEVRNPKANTSLDIIMKRDDSPRSEPMVRMSRSTRELLLFERGDQALIKPIELERQPMSVRIAAPFRSIGNWALSLLIGTRKVHMSVAPGQLWDDEAQVARVNREMLSVLGVNEGDRIRILYRGKTISRILLARKPEMSRAAHDEVETVQPAYQRVPGDVQLNLDAQCRFLLGSGQLEFGTVVVAERDAAHLLQKSLNLSIFSIVGTVITVVALFRAKPIWLQCFVGAFVALLYFYLALSVERSKVG